MSDAGDYWGKTLNEHHLKEMDMEQAAGDLYLFFKTSLGKLLGLSGTYVDDNLRAGKEPFRKQSTDTTTTTFDAKRNEEMPFTFTGIEVSGRYRQRQLSQKRYIEKLCLLMKDCDFKSFRSMRAKLSLVVNSRPDIACAIAFASQVTENTFRGDSYKQLNKVIKHLKSTTDLVLKFPQLDLSSVQLTVYSDVSFNSNSDRTSQLGYIVLLMDHTCNSALISFSSHKSRLVNRSSMAGETLAFAVPLIMRTS